MIMKNYKPYTPSRRKMTVVDYGNLSKERPMKSATTKIKQRAGRNNLGRITVRHKGAGVKKLYRLLDFYQNKDSVEGRIEALEYDPYRSAFIARVVYADGDRRYHLAYSGAKVGDKILTSDKAPLKRGNRLPLSKIPVGYEVHNVEITPGRGGKIIRSAGSSTQILAHEGKYVHLKMPSGEVRKVLSGNLATIGQVSNQEHSLTVIGKAGRKRLMGVRPTVRGAAMNPVDHKYGGGEGRQPRGTKRPKDIWGNVIGGPKTRNKKKWSNKMIVKRRVSKRNKK
ncbi:MAG: 50S ribosomal protein L2 [Candidatus Colwellbacteria bacterium CG10_big_fil_rev_8_21_14_0_10_42_22]|uniref:Large ribosomal subunit protein uL2 n=1 Tax=Candidatus Colwellbacteria bacterium CG10_big_fil_rev_8_21_14_0_10_42_22 TaxID=1974540 RepID=A0A2H0VFH1_9BACT|nr:MAG: 50S ribosomal protein L2 [Candidatus Colwellbacteria bacterium CG10_big_fil_rev_8_21_14_0_10_42_22]